MRSIALITAILIINLTNLSAQNDSLATQMTIDRIKNNV